MADGEVTIPWALTEDNRRIHIKAKEVERHTDKKKKYPVYRCEICKQELIPVKNTSIADHFRHKGHCTDTFSHDMSAWHKAWQNVFPEECREIAFPEKDPKHRADVFFNHFVIEFQHSTITPKEFSDRNTFYTSLGYTVIWLFDAQKGHKKAPITEQIDGYHWTPFETFKGFICDVRPVYIFLEFTVDGQKQIRKLKALSDPYKPVLEFEENFCIMLNNDEDKLRFKGIFDGQDGQFISLPGSKTFYEIIESAPAKDIIVCNMETGNAFTIHGSKNQLESRQPIIGKRTMFNNDQPVLTDQDCLLHDGMFPRWMLYAYAENIPYRTVSFSSQSLNYATRSSGQRRMYYNMPSVNQPKKTNNHSGNRRPKKK